METPTVADAVASGATVILRGDGRGYAIGDVAFFIVAAGDPATDGDVGAWVRPVTWIDGEWVPASSHLAPWYRPGRHKGLPASEPVTILDRCPMLVR